MSISKNDCRLSRKARIRRKINGTADCPRLVVFRSNEHIYAQIINDETGTTLVSASTLTLSKNGDALHSNIAGATGVGKEIARLAKEKDINRVVFDRNGYLYHGRIKAVADGAVKAVWSSNMREKTETPSNEMGEIEKIVALNRVAKVVKGGRRFSFSALVVVGDGKGNVGFGLGKAQEVPEALRKATDKARKTRVFIPLVDGTLPCEVLGRFGAGRVMLKPASEGTGIIAGGAVRAIMEAVGIRDVLAKAIGTNNPHNVLRATMQGLMSLRSAEEVSALRGKKLEAPRK